MAQVWSQREDDINYAAFTLAGQEFAAMDSALDHQFNFTEGVSFLVNRRIRSCL